MGQRQFEAKLYYQLSLERRLNGSDSREQITSWWMEKGETACKAS